MNDLIDDVRITGSILLDGQDINDPTVDVIELRKRVGMVFQKSNPFPKSIYENVAYGLRIAGDRDKRRARRGGREEPARRRPVGRGQGPPARQRPWASPAASSSGCASPGPSPSSPRSSSWTSPARPSIPSPPPRSRT